MEKPDLETLAALKEQYNIGTRAALKVWSKRRKREELFELSLEMARERVSVQGAVPALPPREDLEVLAGLFDEVQHVARHIRAKKEGRSKEWILIESYTDMFKDDELPMFLASYATAYSLREGMQSDARRLDAFSEAVGDYLGQKVGSAPPDNIPEPLCETLEAVIIDFAEKRTRGNPALLAIETGHGTLNGGDTWYARMEIEDTLKSVPHQRLILARLAELNGARTVDELENFYGGPHTGAPEEFRKEARYVLEIVSKNRRWLENYLSR
ncbi:hypothetical protein C4580_05595 [Candidatus Woesearchaeota archaeon]|nr:MAG: hypothetical protein C4580_05595 [Candidatus Woesearchaeota archaeon]